MYATEETESNQSSLRFSIERSFGGSVEFNSNDDDVEEVIEEGDNEDTQEADVHSQEALGEPQ